MGSGLLNDGTSSKIFLRSIYGQNRTKMQRVQRMPCMCCGSILSLVNVVVPFARLYNKCNKIRQQTDGVMGGTPLRDRRGGRLP